MTTNSLTLTGTQWNPMVILPVHLIRLERDVVLPKRRVTAAEVTSEKSIEQI